MLGGRARTPLLAALLLGPQLALAVTAGARPDGAFGYRMFPESSTYEADALFVYSTSIGEVLDPVPSAGFAEATGRRELVLRAGRVAPYGAEAVRFRYRGAAAWVTTRPGRIALPAGAPPRALLLRVTTRRNGGPPVTTEDRYPLPERR